MITDDWSLGYTSVAGDEDIYIGGQKLKVIFAPVFSTCIILLLKIIACSGPSYFMYCVVGL